MQWPIFKTLYAKAVDSVLCLEHPARKKCWSLPTESRFDSSVPFFLIWLLSSFNFITAILCSNRFLFNVLLDLRNFTLIAELSFMEKILLTYSLEYYPKEDILIII